MSWKLEAVICLAVLTLGCVLGAPKSIQNSQELTEAFADFLRQDKEFNGALEKTRFMGDGEHLRFRRESDMSVDGIDMGNEETEERPGFFDKAAKFVMELLQKFLKWINTDGN